MRYCLLDVSGIDTKESFRLANTRQIGQTKSKGDSRISMRTANTKTDCKLKLKAISFKGKVKTNTIVDKQVTLQTFREFYK